METIIGPYICTSCIWFKSYYVVWKLKKNSVDEKEIIEFKSYYVVWKLHGLWRRRERHQPGLNRTM